MEQVTETRNQKMARTGRALGRPTTASISQPMPRSGSLPPAMPEDLGLHGQMFWEAAFKFATWINADLDSYLVAQAARLSDDMAAARADIAVNGRYISNPNGSRQRSPAVVDLEKLITSQSLYLTSLGLTPSDRMRLGIAIVKSLDELDVLNARRLERQEVRNRNK